MNYEQKQEVKSMFEDILKLEDNWNQYGAIAFDPVFVSRIQDIVLCFKNKPDNIVPTAMGSIQIEYGYKEDIYLELNFLEDYNLIIFFNLVDAFFKKPCSVYLKYRESITAKDLIVINNISDIIEKFKKYDSRT